MMYSEDQVGEKWDSLYDSHFLLENTEKVPLNCGKEGSLPKQS